MQDRRLSILFGLDTENFRLQPWPESYSDISPMEKVWPMVHEQLAHHHMTVAIVNELWNVFEAALAAVPIFYACCIFYLYA